MTRERAIEEMLRVANAGEIERLRSWRRKDEFRWEVSGVLGPGGPERTAYVRDSDVAADKLALLRRCLGEG